MCAHGTETPRTAQVSLSGVLPFTCHQMSHPQTIHPALATVTEYPRRSVGACMSLLPFL
jgi:hypothetical protein